MTDKTIAPHDVPVVRDSLGHWLHPSIDWDRIPEDTNADPYLADMGYATAYEVMDLDAPAEVLQRYYDSGDADCSVWTPSRPAGDGWFLGAIYDTESGPAACWVRPLNR